jgi:hypothetical protein
MATTNEDLRAGAIVIFDKYWPASVPLPGHQRELVLDMMVFMAECYERPWLRKMMAPPDEMR